MKTNHFRRRIAFGLAIAMVAGGILLAISPTQAASPLQSNLTSAGSLIASSNLLEDPPPNPVDHSQFSILQKDFASGPDVTAACLSCHDEAAQEIMQTTHWTWEYENPDTGQLLGKKHLINNFCIAIDSNEPRCTSCHAGYGWVDNTFDFTVEDNVDCLVCHDTTGTYSKYPTAAGHPLYEPLESPPESGNFIQPPDLSYIAQNVGNTSRTTCGSCHFYGGGGDGVKHGDMDSSLVNPDYDLDVHMDATGLDFNCTTCHTSDGHQVTGSRYSMNSTDDQTCETCHTSQPHEYTVLNQHIQRIACQTCHIPEYARGGVATKMFWDWSQAGQLNDDGTIKILKDDYGLTIYDSRKGAFELAENVVPDYIWFNGEMEYTLLGDTISEYEPVVINAPQGAIDDSNARIWPMKIFEGIQPYDTVNKTLVIPHLFGSDASAYWKSYDWDLAITAGMEYVSAPYSGQYGFIQSEMYWPITHMVAPASESLICQDCHVEESGRLDFIALGYTEAEAENLTHFPPAAMLGTIGAVSLSPEGCGDCHVEQVTVWQDSIHGNNSVGCVSCHSLQGDEGHPASPYSTSQDANICGACHLAEYHDWEKSIHANLGSAMDPITCVGCHEPHTTEQKIREGAETTCENCHADAMVEMQGSTHRAEGVNCVDCHKVTQITSGHTFTIQSDTCTRCHGDEAHSADRLVMAKMAEPEQTIEETSAAEEQPQGANVVIPAWGYILIGLSIGIAGYWAVKGKEPGISSDDVIDKANGEQHD